MKTPSKHQQQGFTVVELMISLIITGLFIGGGYQMYTVVSLNSIESRQRAVAYNIAKETARKSALESTCSTTPETTTNPIPSSTNLPNPTMQTTISAPYGCGSSPNIIRSETTINFGPDHKRQEVSSAILIREQ